VELSELKKVVIVAETIIKDEVLKHVALLGVKGYTHYAVCGKGERGARSDDAPVLGDLLRNIKVEVITTQEIAEKIIPSVVNRFFKNYAGIAYIEDVRVMRVEKFR